METALKSSESFAGQRRASVEPQYLGSIFKNSIFKCFSVGDKFIFKPKGKITVFVWTLHYLDLKSWSLLWFLFWNIFLYSQYCSFFMCGVFKLKNQT